MLILDLSPDDRHGLLRYARIVENLAKYRLQTFNFPHCLDVNIEGFVVIDMYVSIVGDNLL